MSETIEVFVNGRKLTVYRVMNVKHALIAYDRSLYASARAGLVRVEDELGFTVGLEGAPTRGARLFTVPAGG